MGRKTGLLLANVYQGASRAMWRYASELSRQHEDDALIIIPGGRLGFLGSSEYLRNSIYELAGSASLDGAMIWSSSLTGAEGVEAVSSFVKGIAEQLPVVSMCMTIPGIPSVDFDAYTGIYSAVKHFITIHSKTKIAFIRGPRNHKSAEARYKAYLDALSDSGIPINEELITTPRSWSDGAAAARELILERKLKAGEDFEAVVAASDLLLLGADSIFRENDISIPEDIGIAGFNDNEENQLLDVELTTVRMPIRKILETSFLMLSGISMDNSTQPPSIVLPSDFIIRRSCGCVDSLSGIDNARHVIKDEDSLDSWLRNYLGDDTAFLSLQKMLEYVFTDNAVDPRTVTDAVSSYFDSGAEASTILEAMSWSEEILGKKERVPGHRDYLFSRIAHGSRRLYAREQQRLGEVSRILDTFKTSLLATRSYSALPLIMQSLFPSMGITGALLMLYEDFHYTKMLGGFAADRIYTDSIRFPRNLIVPESLSSFIDKGTFIVEPLFYENQELGYILIATAWCESHVLEDVRAALSSAIKGISLTEVAQKAAESAEEGERKAGEFYASVSEALRGPLSSMHKMLSSKGRVPREKMTEEVRKAEQMLSLSLAEFGELDIEKALVPLKSFAESLESSLSAVVTKPEELPSIEMDEERISELVTLISSVISPDSPPCISFSLAEDGVVIEIKGNAEKLSENPAWKLVARISVHHGFEVYTSENSASFKLPYPNVSGRAGKADSGPVVWLSDEEVPVSIKHLAPKQIALSEAEEIFRMDKLPAVVACSQPELSRSGAAALRVMKKHRSSRQLSFMLFSAEIASSLSSSLEYIRSASDDAIIYMAYFNPVLEKMLMDFGRVEEKSPEDILVSTEGKTRFIVLSSVEMIPSLRRVKRFSSVPVLVVKDSFTEEDIAAIEDVPGVIIANTEILEAPAFTERLVSILAGSGILPPLTGSLVKHAIAFLNRRLSKPISRWQIAESVNISEDYLTRIFRREMGLSPWDYLTRCRVGVASDLLRRTGAPLSEIAQASGFQDQAYFNRVFRRIKGCTPGHYRQSL